MNDPEFQKAFEAQNRRDQIAYSTLATVLSMVLNLFCVVMDYWMYPQKTWLFFQVRLGSVALVGLTWLWFRSRWGNQHHRVFGVMWYASPLAIILWMIYQANDPYSPYYAGLNIVLLAVGLLSPWTYIQNLVSAAIVLVMYVVVCFAMETQQELRLIINNTTFLILTAVIVVFGSVANARQRLREFSLRWELDKNRAKLEETNEKLRELGQVKDRFFANISHELRTPLTLLISPLETLLFQRPEALDEDQKSLLSTMHANGMRLLKMINDLLDLVRLESGRMDVKPEPVEMNEFVRGISAAAKQMAQQKQLQLATTVGEGIDSVMADRDKLEKICLNLLFNALKFTPGGGRVDFRAQRQSEELVLSVQDTGVGISEKNLPHVFDRFWQADNSSKRKFKGVGIGLSLVKELVEIQGGKVSVESEEGKGTTFTVRIPYLKAEAAAAPAEPAAPEPTQAKGAPSGGSHEEWLTNLYRRAELFPTMSAVTGDRTKAPRPSTGDQKTVLIADDEPSMVSFIKSQVQRHYQTIEAVDGAEAVEKATQHLPDIILLDMNMPEKDGLQVCRELRQMPATEKIPIILITARADEETKLSALSAGANDFLSKPFSVAELHVRIKNLVQSHGYQERLNQQNKSLASAIDQLKDTETQLVQTAKMASLGRMSAGIIHEINNPLNFANTGLYSLRSKAKFLPTEQQAEYTEVLKDIEDGLKRVRNIVSDLRTFTHPDVGLAEEVDVSDVVASALRFLSSEWRGRVEIDVDLPKDQIVLANKNRLVQVVLNLVQNSLDAMKHKAFQDERPAIAITGKVTPEKSAIVVRDNGEGIAQENIDKIFDPFFTTKDVGEGMGLGLSICYRIVREYGGQIVVRSERGKFTEFALEFPHKSVSSPP